MSNFSNKNQQPTDEMLAVALGETYGLLQGIIKFIEKELGECHPEWKHYGIKLGWSLKLFHKKRNIVFIGPEDGYFRVAFVFGEKAYQAILNSDLPEAIKQKLQEARVYAEGRPLRLEIREKNDIEPLWQLIVLKHTY